NYKAASGDDFVMLMQESLENYYGVGAPEVEATMLANEWYEPEGGYTDWTDLLFRQGVSKNTEISASGGNEKTQFFISASVLDQQGLALNSDFERYSGRINLTHKISDKITLGVNILNAHTDQNVANNGSSYNNPFYNVSRNTWPTETPYDENGEYTYELLNAGYYNLLREYELMKTTTKVFRSMTSGYIEYKPISYLTFRSTNSYDLVDNDYNSYRSPLSRNGEPLGYVYNRNEKRKRAATSNLVTFDKTFKDLHHLNVIGAFEAEKYTRNYFSATGDGLPNESLQVLSVTAVPTGASGYSSGNSMISYLSRLNYDFDNKYYFSSSFRRDGSSRLGLNEQWANFWSVSGAWRLTQENFMKDLTFIDDLKLRASYGTSGTLPSGYYDHLALYSYTGAYDGSGAAVEDQISNPDLTWEKNKNFNIGFEYGIFKRVRGSFEYFQRHTSDLLMNLALAPTIGAGSTMVNIGEMENKGFEFEIRTDNVIQGDFNWSSTFLFTSVRNKIVTLANHDDIISGRYIRREGLPYYSFYMPIWAGVDPADGTPMWYVIDDEGNITDDVTHDNKEANSAVAGAAEPDFYGSIGNDLSYKGFNLSFIFNFSVGGDIWYNSGYKSWNDGRSPKYVVPEGQVDRWQNPGDIAEHPQRIWTGNNGSDIRSSRFLFDNDYLRLKDLTLSYSIPTTLLQKLSIKNANIYVQGRNLLTFASQNMMDPEHGGASGYAYFEMPPVKTFTFGIEIGF
ncbi:MAG: SusC/RagA family TonB-linked outer membrane protein, partial [Candidatus Cloacimonetes bacterium]|nr:SusC/RagA family TonB-linked outer membrane protein [Candidatus Cloacimonadota bacterium]